MTEEQKNESVLLLSRLENRRRNYGILDATMDRIPKQKELYDDLVKRLDVPLKDRKMFYLYYGGNGSGKTHAGAYVTTLMALGHTTTKYKLPFL